MESIGGVQKAGDNGISTFFPKKWTPEEVIDSISDAYQVRVFYPTDGYWYGKLANGMEIQMAIDSSTGRIITAFPVY